MKKLFLISVLVFSSVVLHSQTGLYAEKFRPRFHFSPAKNWTNDPNGLVYYQGEYHLFYQYNPFGNKWGHMSWGHAVSTDLIHWQHLPIALPEKDSVMIFSGSAVLDENNTSGFATSEDETPMVAIYTAHIIPDAADPDNYHQQQHIAYSVDKGRTWTKYAGNPVLDLHKKDFRDPKVSWHDESGKWIMSLAAGDRIVFYSSPNLKEWTKESEFGSDMGAHGGVWECPDLFPLEYNGEKIWVLLVSINPGGPNKGSATQYFTGRFDGKTFTPLNSATKWMDYGPDNYAGVSYSNTGKRKIVIGWMNNWQYANLVPTGSWRGAMTIPRELSLEKKGEQYFLRSTPVKELNSLYQKTEKLENIPGGIFELTSKTGPLNGPVSLHLKCDSLAALSITLSNDAGQMVVIGYEPGTNQYYIDRKASGKVSFEPGFAALHTAPRLTEKKNLDLQLIIDHASVELFADEGLSVMTQVFFPDSEFSRMTIKTPEHYSIRSVEFSRMKSITAGSAMAVQ